MNADASTRVLIVEDSSVIRLRLRRSLAEIPGLEITGERDDVEGALQFIRRYRPEVIVLDMNLRQGSGYLVLRRMQEEELPGTAVVLTSEPAYRELCFEAGAHRFFDKSKDFLQFLKAMSELCQRQNGPGNHAGKGPSAAG